MKYFIFGLISLCILTNCKIDVNQTKNRYEVFVGDSATLLEAENKFYKTPKSIFKDLIGSPFATDSIYYVYTNSPSKNDWFYEIRKEKIGVIAQTIDSIFHGKYYTYYDNGKVRSIGNYNRGKKSGLWTQFHQNGNQINYGEYRNDKPVETWFFYDSLKSFRQERRYKNFDSYEVKGFDNLDRLYYTGEMTNNQKNGKWIEFDSVGNKTIETNYKLGILHDSVKFYKNNIVVAYQIYQKGNLIDEHFLEE